MTRIRPCGSSFGQVCGCRICRRRRSRVLLIHPVGLATGSDPSGGDHIHLSPPYIITPAGDRGPGDRGHPESGQPADRPLGGPRRARRMGRRRGGGRRAAAPVPRRVSPSPTMPGGRRQLPGLPGRAQYRVPELRGRAHRRGGGERGRRLAQSAYLLTALLTARQVPFEAGPVRLRHRVHRVRSGQGVRIAAAEPHRSTPRQSRSLISPSRIRVLTVPTATPSSLATSR